MVEARRRLLAQQLSAALQKDALTDLVNQFAGLPSPVADRASHTTALSEANRSRNRYNNILALDSTRVQLESVGQGQSNYINANYLQVPGCDARYIATQGPTNDTLEHFWLMVWERGVPVIAMLTRETEKGQPKCARYWPSSVNSPEQYGKVQVMLQSEEVSESCITRQFKLDWLGGDDAAAQMVAVGSARQVTHLQFTSWPDHDVPQPDPFIHLLTQFRRYNKVGTLGSLPVVHCSAGIGRTGAFCAVDTALHMLSLEQDFGPDLIKSIVTAFRKQRAGMVQTPEQFIFCYAVLLRYILMSTGNGGSPH